MAEEKIYLFQVSMKIPHKNIFREMVLKGASSLFEFAEVILDAFDFDLDHAFEFYSDIPDHDESEERYTLFYDIEGMVIDPNENSVENNHIYEVFELGKEMVFLFDYGVEWRFLVECCYIFEAEAGEMYPKVTKKQGIPPPQYPDYDD